MIAICTACIKYEIPKHLQLLAMGGGVWAGQFDCHACGRLSVYTFRMPLPTSLDGFRSYKGKINEVIRFLREDCCEEKWKKESFEDYAACAIKYIPLLNKHAEIDKERTERPIDHRESDGIENDKI